MAEIKTKIKKKHWAQLLAPKSFDNAVLGESFVGDKEELLRKSVTANLMTLTDDPRKQTYNIRFDVKDLREGKATTQVVGLAMSPSAIKRLMRRGRDKIDDSFVVKIAGGRVIRVKPVLVTNTAASKAAQTELRHTVRKRLKDLYVKMRFDDIVKDIIDTKTQRMLRDLCSKTHPLKSADIREVIVLPRDRKMTPEMEAQIEKEVAEEDTRRAQIASAAAAASVGEEQAPAAPRRKPKRREEESVEGPEEPGV